MRAGRQTEVNRVDSLFLICLGDSAVIKSIVLPTWEYAAFET